MINQTIAWPGWFSLPAMQTLLLCKPLILTFIHIFNKTSKFLSVPWRHTFGHCTLYLFFLMWPCRLKFLSCLSPLLISLTGTLEWVAKPGLLESPGLGLCPRTAVILVAERCSFSLSREILFYTLYLWNSHFPKCSVLKNKSSHVSCQRLFSSPPASQFAPFYFWIMHKAVAECPAPFAYHFACWQSRAWMRGSVILENPFVMKVLSEGECREKTKWNKWFQEICSFPIVYLTIFNFNI